MTFTLYELTADLLRMVEQMAEEEDADKAASIIESVRIAFDDKAAAVAVYIKTLEAAKTAMAMEVNALAKRINAIDAKQERLRQYLQKCLYAAGVEKVETSRAVVKLAKNPPKVDIADASAVPSEFMVQKEPPPPSIDKRALLSALKQGREIPGARIVQETRIVIE